MISHFYRRHSRLILIAVALSFLPLWRFADSIRSNNDIETWLPQDTDVRRNYEEFKQDFGAEEVIVIGLPKASSSPELMESLAGRLDRLPWIRHCWTPDRMATRMGEFGVSKEEAQKRIDGLLYTEGGSLVGLVASLSEAGVRDRARTSADVKAAIDYCQFDASETALTGAPIIVSELDRLGSSKSNRRFFLLTCAISLGLLYYSFGHLGLSLATLAVTLWGIFLNQSILALCGGEMNFILGSLSVMVLIFTLSISVHVVSYHTAAKDRGESDPLSFAVLESLRPCLLSTLTTLLGLLSLNVSSIAPVAQFGYAAASGSIVALIVGLGITPALLTVIPCRAARLGSISFDFGAWSDVVTANRKMLLSASLVVLVITGYGLSLLKPDIDPSEFLPRNSRILTDLLKVEKEITSTESIEAVIDFHGEKLAFLDQIQRVREIERKISSHPSIRHTLSLATMFPEEMPDSPLATAKILGLAQSYSGEEGMVADRQRLWRISARVWHDKGQTPVEVLNDLTNMLANEPIRFTGLAPLLKSAQQEIFEGFWQSFTAACLTISLVMILSLRSIVAGIVAMIPNIVPIWLVFGSVGYMGMPVDIGMMMTGSIALGISVDCTFHFLVVYQQNFRETGSSAIACKRALEHSGEPMMDSTLISSFGLMALCLSSFSPTARFGMLMAAQMAASMLGELVILPAMLSCFPDRKRASSPAVASVSTSTETSEMDTVLPIHRFPEARPVAHQRARSAHH